MTSLPNNSETWEKLHRKGPDIHELESVHSGSKIKRNQFLALKVIWPKHNAFDIVDRWSPCFGSSKNQILQEMVKMEQEDKEWKYYIEALKHRKNDPSNWRPNSKIPRNLGTYATAFHNALEIFALPSYIGSDSPKVLMTKARTRSQTAKLQESPTIAAINRQQQRKGKEPAASLSSSDSNPEDDSLLKNPYNDTPGSIFQPALEPEEQPPTKDEETINKALINFLDAHHIHNDRNSDWNATRKQFVFSSSDSSTSPIAFVARTDGHLKIYDNIECSAAIIEVKARRRPGDGKDIRIEMQESAQMALWIFQEPRSHWISAAPHVGSKGNQAPVYHRILVSQDRDEIFIILAEYEEAYLKYLQKKKSITESPYLSMHQFGPFRIKNPQRMAMLAALLRIMLPYATQKTLESAKRPQSLLDGMSKMNLGPKQESSGGDRGRAGGGRGGGNIRGGGRRRRRTSLRADDPFTATSREISPVDVEGTASSRGSLNLPKDMEAARKGISAGIHPQSRDSPVRRSLDAGDPISPLPRPPSPMDSNLRLQSRSVSKSSSRSSSRSPSGREFHHPDRSESPARHSPPTGPHAARTSSNSPLRKASGPPEGPGRS